MNAAAGIIPAAERGLILAVRLATPVLFSRNQYKESLAAADAARYDQYHALDGENITTIMPLLNWEQATWTSSTVMFAATRAQQRWQAVGFCRYAVHHHGRTPSTSAPNDGAVNASAIWRAINRFVERAEFRAATSMGVRGLAADDDKMVAVDPASRRMAHGILNAPGAVLRRQRQTSERRRRKSQE